MTPEPTKSDTTDGFETALQEDCHLRYELRLYIAGMTPRSQEALRNVTRICEEHLAGRFDLQVIDIYQQPTLAAGDQIIAAPTLVKRLPLPLRKLIGSMAQEDKILVGLDIRPIVPP